VPFGAGFADGTQMMQQDLAAIGVRAELRLVDPGVYFQEVNQPQARRGLYVIAGGSGDLDGANDLSGQLSTDPRRYYSNPEFDRLVLQARSEFNMQRREQLLQQAVAIMNDDAPWLLMHGSTWVYGVSDKVIDFDKAWMPNGMWRLDGVSIRR
jgi:ABC-type transport system substrate-binding protein